MIKMKAKLSAPMHIQYLICRAYILRMSLFAYFSVHVKLHHGQTDIFIYIRYFSAIWSIPTAPPNSGRLDCRMPKQYLLRWYDK